jgi:hypothetical protein
MNRSAMIVMVCLAAYALIDLAVSTLVGIVWRTRRVAPADLPPAVRARRIMLLRLTPFAASLGITLFIVAPAFTLFEPVHDHEPFGPMLALLATGAFAHLAASAIWASFSVYLTGRIEGDWRESSTPLATSYGIPAFMIDTASPIVALVGVFRPTLIASRSVIKACTAEEIAAILAHERGHFDARDNFKRWLMASLPDSLRWTRMHYEMLDAWHHAAEDAADDAATGGDEVARADLAALVLKVVRLAPQPMWRGAIVSPFVERDGLERRVRRLIRPELEPPAPFALVPTVTLALVVVASLAILSSPSSLELIFEAFERLVEFGR